MTTTQDVMKLARAYAKAYMSFQEAGELRALQFAVDALVAERDALQQANEAFAKPLGWYCVSSDGMATLCADEEDARKVAKEADFLWPRHGPHKAMQLCEYRDNTKQ